LDMICGASERRVQELHCPSRRGDAQCLVTHSLPGKIIAPLELDVIGL